MEWTNQLTVEFLDLYEAEPALWDRRAAPHADRDRTHDAWKRVQARLGARCSIKELKRKKENLMSTFRKVSAKVRRSEDAYRPEWFAYDKMASFLHAGADATIARPNNDDAPDEDKTQPCDEEEEEAVHTGNDVEDSTIETNGSNDEENEVKVEVTDHLTLDQGGPPVRKRRKCDKTAEIEHRMDEAYHLLKQVATRPNARKDETRLFCDLLCAKLTALDERKRDFVMQEINNLMFTAKNQQFYQPHFSNFPQAVPPYQYQPSATETKACQCKSKTK